MAIATIRRVYLGPKDEFGEEIPEPPYVHKEFPRAMYHASGETVIVNDAAEMESLIAAGWVKTPAELGIETHPSAETLRAQKIASLAAPTDEAKRGPGRPPKIAA